MLYFIDSIGGSYTVKNSPGASNFQAGGKMLIFRQTDSLVLRWKPDGIPDGKHYSSFFYSVVSLLSVGQSWVRLPTTRNIKGNSSHVNYQG
jgi:hypothetical protein